MDIEKCQIDAGKCTDIIALTYIALSHTYDLKMYLEGVGAFRHEKKKAVNQALEVLNSIITEIGISMENSETYKKTIPELFDAFSEMIDSHIGMEGIEREMNIISFCCERAYKYCVEVIKSHSLILKIPHIALKINKVPVFLRQFDYERYDLSFIFNQQLKALYGEGKRNYE